MWRQKEGAIFEELNLVLPFPSKYSKYCQWPLPGNLMQAATLSHAVRTPSGISQYFHYNITNIFRGAMKGWIVSGCMVGPLFAWKKIIIVSLHRCSRERINICQELNRSTVLGNLHTISTESDRLQGDNSQTAGFNVLPEAMKDQLSTGS